jgi:hypothetical protein
MSVETVEISGSCNKGLIQRWSHFGKIIQLSRSNKTITLMQMSCWDVLVSKLLRYEARARRGL